MRAGTSRYRCRVVRPLLVVSLLTFIAVPTAAAPFGLRLTHASDPATSMSISWNGDAADGLLRVGPTGGPLVAVDIDERIEFGDVLGTGFTARLRGLPPASDFAYVVGAAGVEVEGSFSTLSDDPCAPLRFAVTGDNRSSGSGGISPDYPGILEEAAGVAPDFFVNTGDMVRSGSVPAQWSELLHGSQAQWSKRATLPTVGNHDEDDVDGDGALYNRLFDLPRNSATGTEDYWSLDAGAVHFVSLSTQHTSSTQLPEMTAWLDGDLAATTQPWKIVFFHKGLYTRSNHDTGEEAGGIINAAIVPVLDAHAVDLVLNGHSHSYERFVPSRGVDVEFGGGGRVFPAGDRFSLDPLAPLPDGATGTTVVVSGGGGAATTRPRLSADDCIAAGCTGCDGPALRCGDDVTLAADLRAAMAWSGRHHFVSIVVKGGRLQARALSTETGNDDPAALIDELVIDKPGFACRSEPPDEPAVAVGEGEGEGESRNVGEGEGEAPTDGGNGPGDDRADAGTNVGDVGDVGEAGEVGEVDDGGRVPPPVVDPELPRAAAAPPARVTIHAPSCASPSGSSGPSVSALCTVLVLAAIRRRRPTRTTAP